LWPWIVISILLAFGVVAGVGLAVVATIMVAAPAQAFHRATTTACPGGIQFSGGSVQVVLHIGGIGGALPPTSAFSAAVERGHAQFNDVRGTTATISGLTVDPSTLNTTTWYGDTTPTIHVGFVSSFADPNAIMGTNRGPQTSCTYNEARIRILDNNVWGWDYGSPTGNNQGYYNEDRRFNGNTYFVPSYLHELLHAFGLAHATDTYSFLNYGPHPWTRGTTSGFDEVRPLPDEVRALRDLYPGTGTRAEVGLFNTWFEPAPAGSAPDTPADQTRLCSPSLGSDYSASYFDPTCGVDGTANGSTVVCANDRLRVRFTFVNYSTSDVDLTERMYLSTDDVLQTGTDIQSADTFSETGIITNANHVGRRFTVPSLAGFASGTQLYVIIQTSGTTTTGAAVSDWRPLIGTVTVC